MKRALFLLAFVSLPAMAQSDPVAGHQAALNAAAANFAAMTADRDNAIALYQAANAAVNRLTSQTQADATRIGLYQNDIIRLTAERDAALAALQACKTAPGCYVAPTPAPVPVPPPSPPPAPPPAPVDTTTIPAVIPSNFDVASELVAQPIPGSSLPDVLGAFRFICGAGQISYDDPIVYPGQPGKSHLHQFFGNTLADANSTYASLRTTGGSTCMSPLNRSAYWMPAMENDKGQVIKPAYVAIYYKRRKSSDPACFANGNKGCIELPRGLRFIFGFNMLNMTAAPTGSAYFNCSGTGAVSGHYLSLPTAQKNCPVPAQLGAVISAPSCWDGKNLDSADHRSHVAYPLNPTDPGTACPASHPYVIPTFTLGAWYSQGAVAEPWHLSSDVMADGTMMMPGSTFHTDWWGAWDDSVKATWTANCLDRQLNGSGGDLCNGKRMKGPLMPAPPNPRVVPVPVRP